MDDIERLVERILKWIIESIIFLVAFAVGFIIGKSYRVIVDNWKQRRSSNHPAKSSSPTGGEYLELKLVIGCLLLVAFISLIVGLGDTWREYDDLPFTIFFGSLILLAGCVFWLITAPEKVVSKEIVNVEQKIVAEPIIYTLILPKGNEWDGVQQQQFILQLLSLLPEILLQIVSDQHGIRWQIVDVRATYSPVLLEQAIRSQFPNMEVTWIAQPSKKIDSPFYRVVCYYQQPNLFLAPIKNAATIKQLDPLISLTQAISDLQMGERVCMALGLTGASESVYQEGQQLITQSTIHPLQYLTKSGREDAFRKIQTGRDREDRFESQDQRILEEKLRQVLFSATLMVQIDSPEKSRVAQLMLLTDSQIAQYTNPPYNSLNMVERPFDHVLRLIETPYGAEISHITAIFRRWLSGQGLDRPPAIILEISEIAALWHLPYTGFDAPHIQWGSKMINVPSVVAQNTEGVIIGTGKYQGREVTVRLPPFDRQSHMNILGRTGTGKSTLLQALIHQDIANGQGVAVVDPHGTLVKDVLRWSIPDERIEDVVVLDLTDPTHPTPLNPLIGMQGYTSVGRVMAIIERLFEGTEQTARMSNYLRAALQLLQSEPQATMRDVQRVFMDASYRKTLLYRETLFNQLEDPETQDFWEYQFNTSSAAMQRQVAEPIINRIRVFFANPVLYPILCHPDTIDFRSLIQQKKIILISLGFDEEQVPEKERNLVGSLLVSRLQMAGMKDRTTESFYVYIDEVQKFVTTSLSSMFSEARKYGLSLVTANQFLGQLKGKTLQAVMGNVGATIALRCSPSDGQALSSYMKPEVTKDDLVNLDKLQAAVKMQIGGQTQPAFMVMTSPPIARQSKSETDMTEMQKAIAREQHIREVSTQQYTPRTREDVLTWLRDRYPRKTPPGQASEGAEIAVE